MSGCQLTQQTRERVVYSPLNHSSSKQMWTFPKKKRFAKIKPQCPHASYQSHISTINSHYPKFSNAPRAIFEDKEHFPSPADYNQYPAKTHKNIQTFGQSRSVLFILVRNVLWALTYDQNYLEQLQNDKESSSYRLLEVYGRRGPQKQKRFFHETANCKQLQLQKIINSYFIDDKEKQKIPSPFQYDTSLQKGGKLKIAKFRSTNMTGGTGLMCRSQRFLTTQHCPGPSSYEPKKVALRNSFHCTMNKTMRSSWIDRINHKQTSPGPGDYQLPSQFGHYVKPRSLRMKTIQ